MKKLLKFLGWMIAILIVLFVGLIVALKYWFNPNDLKPLITKQFFNATGLHLTIDGNLDVTLFPTVGLKVEDVKLDNPKGFGQQPMATIGDLQLGVAVLPLLHNKLETNRFIVRGLHLNLKRLVDGKANWQAFSVKPEKIEPSAPVIAAGGAAALAKPRHLSITNVRVEDADLVFDDQLADQLFKVTDLKVKASDIALGQTFPLMVRAHVSSKKPALQGDVKLSLHALVGKKFQQFHLNKLQLNTHLKGKGLPQNKLDLQLSGDALMNLKEQRFQLNHMSLHEDHLAMEKANLEIAMASPKRLSKGPYADLRNLLINANVNVGSLQFQQMNMSRVKGKFSAAHGKLTLKDLSGDVAGGQAAMSARLDVSGAVPQMAFSEKMQHIDAHQALSMFNVNLPMKGDAYLEASVETQGDNVHAIQQNLAGKTSFHVKNGAISGLDFAAWSALSLQSLLNGDVPQFGGMGQTAFSDLSGSFTINKGIAMTQDTQLISSLVSVRAKGSANIPKQKLDFVATISPGKGRHAVFSIPLFITGTFTHPHVLPDLKALVKNQIIKPSESVVGVIKKQIDGVGGGVGKHLKNALDSFFK
ncbi:MAG: hypothetical protein DHS20C10_05380 [marine bacterium B5-7]|nr:MAG: hypothetical protein DHS20C10_05380 [marine bacterium B5-7]